MVFVQLPKRTRVVRTEPVEFQFFVWKCFAEECGCGWHRRTEIWKSNFGCTGPQGFNKRTHMHMGSSTVFWRGKPKTSWYSRRGVVGLGGVRCSAHAQVETAEGKDWRLQEMDSEQLKSFSRRLECSDEARSAVQQSGRRGCRWTRGNSTFGCARENDGHLQVLRTGRTRKYLTGCLREDPHKLPIYFDGGCSLKSKMRLSVFEVQRYHGTTTATGPKFK